MDDYRDPPEPAYDPAVPDELYARGVDDRCPDCDGEMVDGACLACGLTDAEIVERLAF